MPKATISREAASAIMSTFVHTLRARQERKGDDSTGSGYFALGYLEALMADIMVENPKVMARIVQRLNTITKDLHNA
jgi:hypothetical protein